MGRATLLIIGIALLALSCEAELPDAVPVLTTTTPKLPDGAGFVDRAADAGLTLENHTGRIGDIFRRYPKDYLVEAWGGGAARRAARWTGRSRFG